LSCLLNPALVTNMMGQTLPFFPEASSFFSKVVIKISIDYIIGVVFL